MDQGLQSPCCAIIFILTLLLIASSNQISSQNLVENPMANLNTSWVNDFPAFQRDDMNFMMLNPILTRGSSFGPWFSCGFYCNYPDIKCIFSVFLFPNSSMKNHSRVVWSANRNNAVSIGATLALGGDGNLVLTDVNGTLVWSTNTGGGSVSGINLTEMGNLVLFGKNNQVIWQSFDHPTDSLVPGQMLVSGQKLISNASTTDWGEGQYSLYLANKKLVASYMESSSYPPQPQPQPQPQPYYESSGEFEIPTDKAGRAYIPFEDGRFGKFNISRALAAQFMRLEADGHVKVYEWKGLEWVEVSDLITLSVGECGYPMVCGNYGICSGGGQCTCPPEEADYKEGFRTSYFEQKSDRQPNLGCSLIRPISCVDSKFHSFVELKNTSYFSFSASQSIAGISLANCQHNCSETCSCKAAVFQYNSFDSPAGNCFLLTEAFSFKDSGQDTSTTAYLKVQNPPKKKTRRVAILLGTSIGALFGAFLIISIWCFIWRNNSKSKEVEEGYLYQVQGTLTRFSYEHLTATTDNFSRKLGEGGFGSVFEGTLHNGTKVAVKRLDKLDLVEKTFLAEVETIGNIHHVNLVRLIGFCIEKSHRLLVYEYMSNGSLNDWIFSKNQMVSLRWQSRRKIIVDIAKGLAYLHEGCRQKIFHLDIKPQNILLDENFNAKLADFGLSKLIDKDQSKVVTTMKGTPGYMAPEWLSSFITEKVDVYSFGVVLLEMLCGRRNLDRSQPEEDMHLLSLFKKKAEKEQLLDMVDKHSEDMQLQGIEVVKMMRVAAWCLQNEFERRPSMTVVVQALEGLVNIEDNLDYDFSKQPIPRRVAAMDEKEDAVGDDTLVLPSVLSGPR